MRKILNLKKTAGLLALVNIAQVVVFAFLTVLVLTSGDMFSNARFFNQYILMLIIVAASFAISLMSFKFRGMLLESDSRNHDLKVSISDLEKLHQTLKAQRHDFLNHLQVVYGLIEMDEYMDARDYIEKVYNDIQKVSKVLKTSNPAVNALIQAKMHAAEKKGIITEFNATTRLNGLPIPSWEMCRVLGNLMDNAIDSLAGKPDQKLIKIDLSEDLKNYYLQVEDNGSEIPENLQKKIFEPGFTTKNQNGEGMGLAITKDILIQYGGEIKVSSSDIKTVFEVSIPKQI